MRRLALALLLLACLAGLRLAQPRSPMPETGFATSAARWGLALAGPLRHSLSNHAYVRAYFAWEAQDLPAYFAAMGQAVFWAPDQPLFPAEMETVLRRDVPHWEHLSLADQQALQAYLESRDTPISHPADQ